MDPQSYLQKYFGFSEFRDGQRRVVDSLLAGSSVLAVFPTGGGKSLCYQLPALMLPGTTIVVSPLIALMKDQIDQLKAKGIKAVRLDSSLTLNEYRESIGLIRSGEAKLLYVAPERFFNERFRASLKGLKISLFAIDEAHCISQWGHNFRPDYLKLARIAESLDVERVLALTATATPEVREDICKTFQIEPQNSICNEFFRPNLHIRSQIVNSENQTSVLIQRLKDSPPGATIVYVSLQKTATDIANVCRDAGLNARAYHAGMETDQRMETQEWFMSGSSGIVVATIAFGMGIDKSNIRYVYHFNPPKSLENYSQEIGRAGRDGEVSRCELLLNPDDRIVLENFSYGDTPTRASILKFIETLVSQPETFFLSQIKLGNSCNIKSLVVKTLLTNLELQGYLEATAARYDSYSYKENQPADKWLSNFEGERLEFARQLMACGQKKKVWHHLELVEVVEKLGCDRSRAITALDYFAEQGWIELRSTGLVHGYRKLKPMEPIEELVDSFHDSGVVREKSEAQRIAQVVELATATTCQAAVLSEYFGQALAQPCGECSFCVGEGPFELPPPLDDLRIPEETMDRIRKLVVEYPEALESSRSVARLLCGINSPFLARAKLSKDQCFGRHAGIPFGSVIDQVSQAIKFA